MRTEERDFGVNRFQRELNSFEDVLPLQDALNERGALPKPIVRRKPFGQHLKFWLLNLIVAPILFMLCLAVAADGLRRLISVLRMKLYRMPLPGFESLAGYEGFADVDLAHLASTLLFIAVALIWVRIIREMKGNGELLRHRKRRPLAFGLYAAIASILLTVDAYVFWAGISNTGGAWNETPALVPIGCTAMYIAGVAAFAAFHHDHHYSDTI